MRHFWVILWSMLPPLARSSDPDRCGVHEILGSQHASSLLRSLECFNDYESYVYCKWRVGPPPRSHLQLWFQTDNDSSCRKRCVPQPHPHPHPQPQPHPQPHPESHREADESRTVQCRYETRSFSIGIKHTVFFLKNETLRPSAPRKPLDLSQLLRAHPPVNLSTHAAADGGRRLSWCSPYPASSSLNKDLTYQLSYRTDRQDSWTTQDVSSTEVTLDKHLLLPGQRYEARVRGRASVGQWSDWTPVETWRTEEDTGQSPSLHCVLEEEREVVCSWEVSRELDHFITYQLACRHNQTALSETCCVNPTVSSDLGRKMLMYSCSLTVTQPAHLLLELLPTRNAKTFSANKHIRPKPPQRVKVREKDNNWIVEWTKPSTASKLRLYYQVCYYNTQDEGSSVLLNISEGSMSLAIPGASLTPSQEHQVKVRSVVVRGEGSHYEGTPSEWTDPAVWTSHAATWSLSKFIYIFISVFVTILFFTLYFTISACRRRLIVWVESVPSPGKSKILSEVKSLAGQTLIQSDNSTCSSNTWLWPTEDADIKGLEQEKGCRRRDDLLSPAEKVNGSDFSTGFSGPYIFCQSPQPNWKSVEDESDGSKKEEEASSDDPASPPSIDFSLHVEADENLPGHSVPGSNNNPEPDRPCADDKLWYDRLEVQPSLGEPTNSHQPSGYTSGPPTPWPTMKTSGYCLLPTAASSAAK